VGSVIFTPAARAEMTDAQDWYEREAPGLGRHFRVEIERTVRRMMNNPLQFPLRYKTLRHARVNTFPYSCSSPSMTTTRLRPLPVSTAAETRSSGIDGPEGDRQPTRLQDEAECRPTGALVIGGRFEIAGHP